MNDTNDIPEVVSQPGADILPFLPPEMQKWALLALVLLPYFTRSWHALTSGGGISGAWRAIWFGTNTPKDTKPVDAGKVASLLLAGLLCFGASAMVQGCKTIGGRSSEVIAYKSISTIETAATAAFDAYIDGVIKRRISTNGVPEVSKSFNRLQGGIVVAIDMAAGNPNAASPESLSALSDDLLSLISEFSR